MPTFTYDGLNRDGQAVRGDVVADSSRSAIERLREAGVVVTNINEVQEKKGVKRSGGKVKIGELSLFARQLASMLSAGVPVTRSMITLAKQTENKTLAQTISTIASFCVAINVYKFIENPIKNNKNTLNNDGKDSINP